MKFGEKIRKLRTQRGLSQMALAEQSGLSQTHLSLIEQGHIEHPHLDTTKSLLRGLDLDPDRIVKVLFQESDPELFFDACEKALPAHRRG